MVNKAQTRRTDETTRRPRGRPKVMSDAAQRALIVTEARKLLLEKGYGRTTTDDVAARCRISKQTLYRHFPGKPALIAAVVDSHRQSMLDLPNNYDGLPLDEALEKIFKIDIDPKADKERVALLRLVLLEALQFPELEDILRRHGGDRSREELAKWLSEQCRRGLMAIEDVDSVAQILMDMIFGAVVFKASRRLELPGPKERNAHIRRCIAIFLNGVVPR